VPHAVHIHYGEEARHECPTPGRDDDGDRMLSASEGGPAYGPIVASLTTSGTVGPENALELGLFSTAPGGVMDYRHGGIVGADTVGDIRDREGVVVVHGVDHDHDGTYGFGPGASELDPSLPREGTDVAACGVLR